MPCDHEFQIIDNIETYDENKYQFYKEGSVIIDDDFLSILFEYSKDESRDKSYDIWELDTYFHNPNRPGKGLAWCGITLIPPSSFNDFKKIIETANAIFKSIPLYELLKKIDKATEENKWILHLGV